MKEKDRHARNKIDKEHEIWKKNKTREEINRTITNKNKDYEEFFFLFLWTETQNNKNKRYDLTLEPKLWYQLMWTRKVRTREPTNKMNREPKKANMIRKKNLRPVEY